MANGEYGDIGLRVRQRREELGLTREKMAERAGLSVQFMASVELGKQSMTTDSLKKGMPCAVRKRRLYRVRYPARLFRT